MMGFSNDSEDLVSARYLRLSTYAINAGLHTTS